MLIRVPNMNYYLCYSLGCLMFSEAQIYDNTFGITVSDGDVGQEKQCKITLLN